MQARLERGPDALLLIVNKLARRRRQGSSGGAKGSGVTGTGTGIGVTRWPRGRCLIPSATIVTPAARSGIPRAKSPPPGGAVQPWPPAESTSTQPVVVNTPPMVTNVPPTINARAAPGLSCPPAQPNSHDAQASVTSLVRESFRLRNRVVATDAPSCSRMRRAGTGQTDRSQSDAPNQRSKSTNGPVSLISEEGRFRESTDRCQHFFRDKGGAR